MNLLPDDDYSVVALAEMKANEWNRNDGCNNVVFQRRTRVDKYGVEECGKGCGDVGI